MPGIGTAVITGLAFWALIGAAGGVTLYWFFESKLRWIPAGVLVFSFASALNQGTSLPELYVGAGFLIGFAAVVILFEPVVPTGHEETSTT